MLKTLEEPPEYLKFVLATTDPQKVPATVLSRCLQFNLRPMAPETVLEHLTHVLAQENVPAEAQALRLLARAARGSMRDALSLTDQAIAFGSGHIAEAGVRLMLGSVDRSYVFQLIDALARGDGKTLVDTVDVLRLNGLSGASTLEDMSAVLQRMAVLQAVPQRAAAAVDASDPDAAEVARLAALLPADETQLLYSICLHGRGELGLAPDEYSALTMVLLRLLAFKPEGTVAEKKTLKPAAEPTAPAPTAVSALAVAAVAPVPLAPSAVAENIPKPPAAPVLPAVVAIENVVMVAAAPIAAPTVAPVVAPVMDTADGDLWHSVVQALAASEAITALVRELALQSQLIARQADHWLLRVERESLNQPTARERLRTALEAAGHTAQIEIEVGTVTDSPARRNAVLEKERQRLAQETVMNDPFVQAMVQAHDAKIVPGSIAPPPR
jgi:DNA polymerase-3 subunit gamma/tau